MKITTVRTTAGDAFCPDGVKCVSLHDLDLHPERRYVITKRETDPEILAAFAPLIGDDEQLGFGPAAMFPAHACTCGGGR